MTAGISAINGNVASAYNFPKSYSAINNHEHQVDDIVTSNAKSSSLVRGSNNIIIINGEDKSDPMQSLMDAVVELSKLNAALEVIGAVLDVSL